ncbi:2-C-methyl-D-erythritol 4-phosphate cytidylyltransferase [Pusillimonas sp. MFBS29]|uniref:IspD/TarI family cytidylyltransferase n=1 Tax=Pusillimonas sp. MFBS29 TaxID=2886690 RepID=UPI001D12837D|nr:2-C-methyl-D-erythritol 4-phosphate cytidylyltransferase [Pusillimonas sp. MFBS29]MCC2595101.1 2-C-methyl-D-erythritol 4-phosphate cytidylyltransferase [Pusillimonas sp. MFBS29]
MPRKLIAIVPAAGIGARAQSGGAGGASPDRGKLLAADSLPKQYRLLKGEPMLRWAVKALLADARIEQVRVAVAAHDGWVEQALAGLPRTVWRPCGGPTRAATVLAALHDAALDSDDWVLVHDAARPGLPASALRSLIDVCLRQNAGGLLAQPVADTVKLAGAFAVDDAGSAPVVHNGQALAGVEKSVPRERLWLAQTPQMFPAARLSDALQAGTQFTDEASAIEAAGFTPLLVPGSVRNFKVTWPEDFELMEKWL